MPASIPIPHAPGDPTATEFADSSIVNWSREHGFRPARDSVAQEEPLEIRIQGRAIAVIMRTPGYDRELAAGFLAGEGLLQRADQILEMVHCRQAEAGPHQNILNVFLHPSVEVDFERLTRSVYASSSCGLCGKASIETVHQHFAPVTSNLSISPDVLLQLPGRLRAAQQTFDRTGGLHAAGIFHPDGTLLVCREDVGRHNAVDKVVGHGLLNRLLPWEAQLLLVSGRTSFEILQKALAARIPIIASISAPSHLAIEFARESGQTLIGFLRPDRMNIYSMPERVRNRT